MPKIRLMKCCKTNSCRIIKIGSDPEFGLVTKSEHRQVSARKYVDNPDETNGIGLDGHDHIGEIRTYKGDRCPIIHATRLEKLLKTKLAPRIPSDLLVKGGSLVGGDPIGGHMHFGVPMDYDTNNQKYIDALNLFLAVPSLMIENNQEAVARRSRYGHLGAYRNKQYGFEYRTPPSWLVSKGFAKSFLSTGYIVVDHIANGGILPSMKDLGARGEGAFKTGDRKYFVPYMNSIYKCIKRCRLYKKYAMPVSSLFGFAKAFNGVKPWRNWRSDRDILTRWGIRAESYWQLSYNPKDYKIHSIVRGFLKLPLIKKIRVYGIKDARVGNCDIFVSPPLYGYKNMVFEKRLASKADIYIGFSHRIRDGNMNKCREIVEFLIHKHVARNTLGEIISGRTLTILEERRISGNGGQSPYDICYDDTLDEELQENAVDLSNYISSTEFPPTEILGDNDDSNEFVDDTYGVLNTINGRAGIYRYNEATNMWILEGSLDHNLVW